MNKGSSRRVAMLTAALFVAVGWVVFSFQQSLRPVTPSVIGGVAMTGKPVEDFTLPDENGRRVRLADYKGQIVALVFYASW